MITSSLGADVDCPGLFCRLSQSLFGCLGAEYDNEAISLLAALFPNNDDKVDELELNRDK